MRNLILTLTAALLLVGAVRAQCTFTTPTSGSTTQNLGACCATGTLFLDSGLDNAYSNNEDGTLTLTASPPDQIEMRFDSFDTEQGFDTLWVYDGPNTSAPLLAILNGVAGGPFMLRTTGNQVTFRFKSDASIVRRGWRARLLCVTSGTACMYNMPASPQTVDLSAATCCGGAGFFDSGGSAADYGNNEDRTI
ncbi:MAG: CUB domain-containing protein, partial [Bacteroidia bacterium]|nr:CUB domain-containing protein [Bacteroidia bacterium]MDW8236230.1 CUB domain-containing protein [Bacteroidia bacterium]